MASTMKIQSPDKNSDVLFSNYCDSTIGYEHLECKTYGNICPRHDFKTKPKSLFSGLQNSTDMLNTGDITTVDKRANGDDKHTKDDYEYLLADLQEGATIPSCKEFSYFGILANGRYVTGDFRAFVDTPPEWFDMKKFRKGQVFAMNHIFGLFSSHILSLMLLLTFPDGLEPLIFTRKSDTPYKAFKRYLSTILRFKSWYEDDFWIKGSPARKNLMLVRSVHERVRQQMSSYSSEKLKEKVNLNTCLNNTGIWSTKLELLSDDFKSLCPFTFNLEKFSKNKSVFLSQTEMSVTQFGFVCLMVLYPDKFGAPDATDEDLDCFLHLWRAIGYCLGIDDKYNFCNGSLEEVKQRCENLLRYYFKPSFSRLTAEWEHMCRCVVEGVSYFAPGMSFEILLYYLVQVLGLHAPRIYDSLSVFEKFRYLVTWLIITFLPKFHLARMFLNWITLKCLRRAQNGSDKWLKSLENRIYQYRKHACS